jgi:hypothetical protein
MSRLIDAFIAWAVDRAPHGVPVVTFDDKFPVLCSKHTKKHAGTADCECLCHRKR